MQTNQTQRDSFIFYRSYQNAIDTLPVKEQVKLYKAIIRMSLDNEEVELTGTTYGMFALIIPQIEANQRKYLAGRKGAEFGKLGGRPRKQNNTENMSLNQGSEDENVNGSSSDENDKESAYEENSFGL